MVTWQVCGSTRWKISSSPSHNLEKIPNTTACCGVLIYSNRSSTHADLITPYYHSKQTIDKGHVNIRRMLCKASRIVTNRLKYNYLDAQHTWNNYISYAFMYISDFIPIST